MSRRDSQRKLDEEVSAYQQRIRELKTRRNSYADISVLPQELLIDIFLRVQARPFSKAGTRSPTFVDIDGMQPSAHLSYGHTTYTSNQDYTNLMLERSKSANLHIFLYARTSTVKTTSIFNHVGRIQTLDMASTTGPVADVCERLITSSHTLSRLESLDVAWSGKGFQWTFPSILIRQSSSLRSLHLSGLTFDWQIHDQLNLTSLRMQRVNLTKRISDKTLLDTLGQMTRLQHLSFDLHRLLLPHDAPRSQASRITLPHLRTLDVADNNSEHHIPDFLSHLVLPKLHNLMINALTAPRGSYPLHTVATIATILENGDFRVTRNPSVSSGLMLIYAPPDGVFVGIRLPQSTNRDDQVLFT
ncbi:hypothetical protein D9619_004225 [Psilocybe cf. subviscida]|uniref:F-box domain-containing protein n=1 Tax=Psilocybe cf. subviscida TaxID=2480587 RepID=A0A8H5BQG1_9AGAR|nr:hypothetical protein D9619_004225 [Psilocybe cf. subviscida]